MMRRINVGIIGCGDVTERKSGPAFQKVKGSNLYAVMRRDEDKLKDYAQRHGVDRYSTDYLDLLQDPAIDLIYIATPPDKHCFYTLEAARHGKAVYVEKPMGVTVAECGEMIQVCEDENVPLFVAYYRREQEKFKKVKELIETGALGGIRSFSYQYTSSLPKPNASRSWLLDKEVSGGGQLYDIGSHMIDTMLFLFGDVKMATGTSSNQSEAYRVNDNTSGLIRFVNGVQGTLQLTFNGYHREDAMTVIGDKGSIVFSIMSNDPLMLYTEEGVEEFVFDPMDHVQMPLITRVIDTLLDNDNYEADGVYGLRTQEILETFENSESIQYE